MQVLLFFTSRGAYEENEYPGLTCRTLWSGKLTRLFGFPSQQCNMLRFLSLFVATFFVVQLFWGFWNGFFSIFRGAGKRGTISGLGTGIYNSFHDLRQGLRWMDGISGRLGPIWEGCFGRLRKGRPGLGNLERLSAWAQLKLKRSVCLAILRLALFSLFPMIGVEPAPTDVA